MITAKPMRDSLVQRIDEDGHQRRRPWGPSLTPLAEEFAQALLKQDRDRAIATLVNASEGGWDLGEIEEEIVAPAVYRLGALWTRGRLTDDVFNRAGGLAERVEWSFRQLVTRERSAPTSD